MFPYEIRDLKETPLGTLDRAAFHCGVSELDEYFCGPRIERDVLSGQTSAFVLSHVSSASIIGFYTLSNYAIVKTSVSSTLANKLKYAIVPSTLIGRLAIQETLRGDGREIGKFLLLRAQLRSLRAAELSASRIIVVDTIHEKARTFYDKHGYSRLKGDSDQFFIDLRRVKKNVDDAKANLKT